jgi:hypothetical protein
MHQASQLTIDLVSRPSASRRQPTTCRTGGPTWVEPAQLPSHGDVSSVGGNAPYWVKHLNNNTFMSYGVGNEDCFAHPVGKAVRFVEVNVTARCGASVGEPDVLEASTVAHVTVSKSPFIAFQAKFFCFACAKVMLRHAQRGWNDAWRVHRLSDRHVRPIPEKKKKKKKEKKRLSQTPIDAAAQRSSSSASRETPTA